MILFSRQSLGWMQRQQSRVGVQRLYSSPYSGICIQMNSHSNWEANLQPSARDFNHMQSKAALQVLQQRAQIHSKNGHLSAVTVQVEHKCVCGQSRVHLEALGGLGAHQ